MLRASRPALEHPRQQREVDETEKLAFPCSAIDLVRLQNLGQVDERALGRSAWDAAMFCAFGWCYWRTTGDQVWASSVSICRDYLWLPGVRPHAPQRARRTVAENGTLAACEHGGEPPPLLGNPRMTDRIHAAVDQMQSPGRHTAIDHPRADPYLEQLKARHHPVLPRRQGRDQRIDPGRGNSTTYTVVNCPLSSTRGHRARPSRTTGNGTVTTATPQPKIRSGTGLRGTLARRGERLQPERLLHARHAQRLQPE
jgi:hypothetical protein